MTATEEQIKQLLDSALSYAKKMFEEFGDFYPFGISVDTAGEMVVHGTMKFDDQHDTPELFMALQQMLCAKAEDGAIIAAAIGANVDIPVQLKAQYPDGIGIFMESENFTRCVYLPYRIHKGRPSAGEGGSSIEIEYGQPLAITFPPSIFVAASES